MAKDEPKGSFIRWQSITIAQFSYAINLILGLTIATLAFQVTLLLNKDFNPVTWQKCIFSLSLLSLLVSSGCGIWCVINRLRDFRATTKAARLREEGAEEDKINHYRALYKRLGKNTWTLFRWQIGAFALGIFLVILSVVASVWGKLI
ncbi:MAG: hypothetical protein Q8K68_10880 [Nitrospirota bacterium]|nr:hypothetical protein [Nitrospirota bacterium]